MLRFQLESNIPLTKLTLLGWNGMTSILFASDWSASARYYGPHVAEEQARDAGNCQKQTICMSSEIYLIWSTSASFAVSDDFILARETPTGAVCGCRSRGLLLRLTNTQRTILRFKRDDQKLMHETSLQLEFSSR
jgi:hypothetical protein